MSVLFELKEKLFNLYQKLNIDMLRLSLMTLSMHDKYCNSSQILAFDDLLIEIQKCRSNFYALNYENMLESEDKK